MEKGYAQIHRATWLTQEESAMKIVFGGNQKGAAISSHWGQRLAQEERLVCWSKRYLNMSNGQ